MNEFLCFECHLKFSVRNHAYMVNSLSIWQIIRSITTTKTELRLNVSFSFTIYKNLR